MIALFICITLILLSSFACGYVIGKTIHRDKGREEGYDLAVMSYEADYGCCVQFPPFEIAKNKIKENE